MLWGYDYWEIFTNYLSFISDDWNHFWSSCLLGLAVSLLMGFAFFVSFRIARYVRLKLMGLDVTSGILPITTSDVVWGIIISSILVGFSFSWGLHYFLDGLFNTPLSPPLDLNII